MHNDTEENQFNPTVSQKWSISKKVITAVFFVIAFILLSFLAVRVVFIFGGEFKFKSDNSSLVFYSKNNDLYYEGNPIVFRNEAPSSKAYLTWVQDDKKNGGAYNNQEIGWFGCHHLSETDKNKPTHQHCSIETWDTDTGYLNTRFGIDWGRSIDETVIEFVNVGLVRYGGGVDVKISGLAGEGNAYACVRSDGTLFRSNTPCR